MKVIDYCNSIIRWSFYALFFLVPLVLAGNTSELFELNKMWLTWGLSIVIVSCWVIKMTIERKFFVQRTLLDIPILLFLLSQLISTLFSLDSRVSFWGYYSRFNGGFLSLLTYTVLYYAFVSNVTFQELKRFFWITVSSGLVVALWGLPSHFGYDPTCLLFRGTFDTSCWTESFKPTIRIFSTLGQPAWMAAYLTVLLPLTMALWIKEAGKQTLPLRKSFTTWKVVGLFLAVVLFYVDLLYTNTRGGFLAFWAANALFWGTLFFLRLLPYTRLLKYFLLFNIVFLMSNFFIGTPISQFDKFTYRSLQSKSQVAIQQRASTSSAELREKSSNVMDPGITDSGKIRLLVWKGAIDAWKAHPIFGTGVETFAFAYYLFRPQEHNLTSEWDYLYNKAHNEYLNYLTTTGIVGLGTHLLFLGGFLFFAAKKFIQYVFKPDKRSDIPTLLLSSALPAAFVGIIISNFFGFSVVIMNIFLYFIPAWFFMILGMLEQGKGYTFSFPSQEKRGTLTPYQWTILSITIILAFVFMVQLIRFWQADTAYALGYNYNRAGSYDAAYPHLSTAVAKRPAEPVFKDELSINLATLATALIQNNNATAGSELAQQALLLSDEVTTTHPNNVVFWKSRVRVLYLLAQVDQRYYKDALDAILKAQKLAPSDAKISYNVGVLYGQNGKFQDAIKQLSTTIALKPNYRDAYYARAIFYRQLAEKAIGSEKSEFQKKANADLTFILKNIDPADQEVRKMLDSWGAL